MLHVEVGVHSLSPTDFICDNLEMSGNIFLSFLRENTNLIDTNTKI